LRMFAFVQSLVTLLLKKLGFLNKRATLILLGLDNAGKTTLQCKLQTGMLRSFAPTTRAKSEEMVIGGIKMTAWDLGGHAAARHLWKNYWLQADGIVFMIDSADPERFEEARQELEQLALSKELPADVPVVIFGNKCERKDSAPAEALAKALDIAKLHAATERPIELFMISCLKGEGYEAGFRWLSHYLPD